MYAWVNLTVFNGATRARFAFRNGVLMWMQCLIVCKFKSFQIRYTVRRLPLEVKKNQIEHTDVKALIPTILV